MPSPALLVAVPLTVAAFLAGFRKLLPRWSADLLSILTALANLVLAGIWLVHAQHRTEVYWFGNWFPRGQMALGIGFVMDATGCGLAALTALQATLALLFSWKHTDSGGDHYHPLMLVFLAAMCGFAVTGDIFNLFVFFELMSTAAFALCGLKTAEPAPLAGAFNFAVTNTVAAFMVLTGIALLYAATGALNLAQIGLLLTGRHDRLVIAAFAFLICGFLVKAAAVPFHFWLPDAHAVAPTSVCVLFSGVMVELGLFGAMRLYATIFQGCFAGTEIPTLFVISGTATAVWGGVMCFAEHHFKRMLAFSTVSHAGLMTLAFGLWTKAAMSGLFFYLVGHAFVKAALFFTAGILLHRFRSVSEPWLFGKAKVLRWTGVLWFLGGLGLAAMPCFALSIGESQVTHQAEWTEVIFLIAGGLTAAAVLRAGFRVFAGLGDAGPVDRMAIVDEEPETDEQNQTIPWYLFVPPLLCLIAAIALTFWSRFADDVASAAGGFMDFQSYAHAVYHQFSSAVVLAAPHKSMREDLQPAALRLAFALLVALVAVFHRRIPRLLRWPSHLEGPMRPLRELQSGHPGDYVAWLTVGSALLGGVAFWLGR
ncbi:MAG: complex I subunit 5 family protein [Acidobacteriaceae bacterium]